MRCPYCRTVVTWGLTGCPQCHARISYGCKVPVTGFLLTVVVGVLTASSLIPILSTRDAAGNPGISGEALAAIGGFSLLAGLGLWFLMIRIARRFVSFSRRRTDQGNP
jgi:hypothetical protein